MSLPDSRTSRATCLPGHASARHMATFTLEVGLAPVGIALLASMLDSDAAHSLAILGVCTHRNRRSTSVLPVVMWKSPNGAQEPAPNAAQEPAPRNPRTGGTPARRASSPIRTARRRGSDRRRSGPTSTARRARAGAALPARYARPGLEPADRPRQGVRPGAAAGTGRRRLPNRFLFPDMQTSSPRNTPFRRQGVRQTG